MKKSEIVILAPVLRRPGAAAKLAQTVTENSTLKPRLLFICSDQDFQEIAACRKTGADVTVVPWTAGPADWQRKLEHGRAMTTEPYMLLAADDLRFHRGWDVNAMAAFDANDIGVLGTLDGGNPLVLRGLHSTHPMVCRGYADAYGTIDDPTLMLHQGYDHQYCDNELCETAMARGCWYFARNVFIEHLHPSWKKAKWDGTYTKGSAKGAADNALFNKRRRLWRGSPLGRPPRAPARVQAGDGKPSARYGQIAHRSRRQS